MSQLGTFHIGFLGGSINLAQSSVLKPDQIPCDIRQKLHESTVNLTDQTYLISLVGRSDTMPGDIPNQWKWLYVQLDLTGVETQLVSPVFYVPGTFEPGQNKLHHHRMLFQCLSAQQAQSKQTCQEPWQTFAHHQVCDNGFYFQHDQPFATPYIRVAYGLPYPSDCVASWLNQLQQKKAIQPLPKRLKQTDQAHLTHSAIHTKIAATHFGQIDRSPSPFVIAQSAGGQDSQGRSFSKKPIVAFRITSNPPQTTAHTVAPKRHIILMSGVHPNEGPAQFVLEAVVNRLVQQDQQAQAFREKAIVDVYPLVNPDGRDAGLNRTTLQHPNRDSNRVWSRGLYHDMFEINAVAEHILANLPDTHLNDAQHHSRHSNMTSNTNSLNQLTQAPVDLFIDFHAWCRSDTGPFGILSFEDGFHQHPFWQTLTADRPDIGTNDSGWQNPSTETWAYQTLKASFAATLEVTHEPSWDQDKLKQLGHDIANALIKTL